MLAIADFIGREGPQAALNVMLAIEERAASLATFPGRGRSVPELERTGKAGFRETILPPWRIVYAVEPPAVTVWAVLDGRRKVMDFLLQVLAERGEESP